MRIASLVKMLRPAQWLKNLMLYFPPFLGGALLQPGVLERGVVPFAAFCLGASATYAFNDVCDRHHDRHHPRKQGRPVASGEASVAAACLLGGALLALALATAFTVSRDFFLLLLLYLAISLGYSVKFKEIPVLDLFCISSGFLIRLQAGGEAFGIVISEWLFLCVFLLSLFLSTGKRLGEVAAMGASAGSHRKSLLGYPKGFLDGVLALSGSAVLVTYTMYVISRHALVYTVVLCCFGLLRFMLRVKRGQGGDPTDSLLKDPSLFAVGLGWALSVAWIIYR